MKMKDDLPVHRLRALESRYRATLRKLRIERRRPGPDSLVMQSLKRKRAYLKDQIVELMRPFSKGNVKPGH